MDSIFINCKNLEFINLKNDVFSKLKSKDNAFQGIKPNFVICIDPNSILIRNNTNKSCVTISCEQNWKHYQKKINPFTNDCVEKCGEKYEYDNQCLNDCPDNYKPNIYNICEPIIISTTETIKKKYYN